MKKILLLIAFISLYSYLTLISGQKIEKSVKKKACLKTIYEPEYDWDQYKLKKYGKTDFKNDTEELIRYERYIKTVYEVLKTNCLHDYQFVSLSAFTSDFSDLTDEEVLLKMKDSS